MRWLNTDDVVRELRYCAASPGGRQGGRTGEVQDFALGRGWLEGRCDRSGLWRLHITAAGHAWLAKHTERAA